MSASQERTVVWTRLPSIGAIQTELPLEDPPGNIHPQGIKIVEAVSVGLVGQVKFAEGTTLILTAGAYDDLCISECLVTSVDCDLSALAQLYVGEVNPEGHAYQDCTDDFAAWLVAKHFAVPLPAEKVHLGDYSTFVSNLVPQRGKTSAAGVPV